MRTFDISKNTIKFCKKPKNLLTDGQNFFFFYSQNQGRDSFVSSLNQKIVKNSSFSSLPHFFAIAKTGSDRSLPELKITINRFVLHFQHLSRRAPHKSPLIMKAHTGEKNLLSAFEEKNININKQRDQENGVARIRHFFKHRLP